MLLLLLGHHIASQKKQSICETSSQPLCLYFKALHNRIAHGPSYPLFLQYSPTTSFPMRNLSCLCSATIFSSTSTPTYYALLTGIWSTCLRLVRKWKINQSSLIVFGSDPEMISDLPSASESQSQDLNPDVLTMGQLSPRLLHFSSHPKTITSNLREQQSRGRTEAEAKSDNNNQGHFQLFQRAVRKGQELCLQVRQSPV